MTENTLSRAERRGAARLNRLIDQGRWSPAPGRLMPRWLRRLDARLNWAALTPAERIRYGSFQGLWKARA